MVSPGMPIAPGKILDVSVWRMESDPEKGLIPSVWRMESGCSLPNSVRW